MSPLNMDIKMKTEEKKRLYKILLNAAVILGIGIGYVLFVNLTGLGIPCVFNLVTGLKCPGCGISRMFLALFRLDFIAAAKYNLLVFILLPFFIVLLFYKSWQYVKNGKTEMGIAEKVFYSVAFVLCIIFFVLRNTTGILF